MYMRKIYCILISAVFLLIIGCSSPNDNDSPPVANFRVKPHQGTVPLKVTFIDQSESISKIIYWHWNFGDGTSITGTDYDAYVEHIYNAPGMYDIALTVTNGYGHDSHTINNAVTATAPPEKIPPVAGFSSNIRQGIVPLEVQFTDESKPGSSAIIRWYWDFGDGITFTGTNPLHAYTKTGTYDVQLTVETADGENTLLSPEYITVRAPAGPTASFTATPRVGEAPLSVQFYDISNTGDAPIISFYWTFGDGHISRLQNPYHIYQNVGMYSVTLRVTTNIGQNTTYQANYIRVNIPDTHEGEGEVQPEGEGEIQPEGEGEIQPEGEGETLLEGEGEVLPEGEGEIQPEGEGEVLPEGEGEIRPEGEGEDDEEGECVLPLFSKDPVSRYIDAGEDVTFTVSATGTLPLQFTWHKKDESQIITSGMSFSIEDAQETDEGVYYCIATNSCGADTSENAVLTVNNAPIASAGEGQTVYTGETVLLDGSTSSDMDGDVFSFTWAFSTIPEGSQAVLSDVTLAAPTFIPDMAGAYIISLVVNDGRLDSRPDTVAVLALDVPTGMPFLQRQGSTLIVEDTGEPIILRAMGVTNDAFNLCARPQNGCGYEMQSEDYAEIVGMGFNAVRFYLAPSSFNWDENRTFEWLDDHLEMAEDHGLYVVLDMHAPSPWYADVQCDSPLWSTPSDQAYLAGLWGKIAERYQDRGVVAAYNLLNEPRVNADNVEAWQALAQMLLNAIREKDQNHLVVIEETTYICDVAEKEFPVTDDPQGQILYEAHIYDPLDYTHQLLTFETITYPEFGAYGSAQVPATPDYGTENTPGLTNHLDTGTHDWIEYQSEPYTPPTERHLLTIGVVAYSISNGSFLLCDSVTIDEYKDGVITQHFGPFEFLGSSSDWEGCRLLPNTVVCVDNSIVGPEITTWTWLETYEGRNGVIRLDGPEASNTTGSVMFLPRDIMIPIRSGCEYRARADVKYALNTAAWAGIQLFSFRSSTGEPVALFDRNYLENKVQVYSKYATTNNVPLWIGEWGLGYPCFQEDRNGLAYIEDMIEILANSGLGWSYHAYHDGNFGLFGLDPIFSIFYNEGLADVFKAYLPIFK